MKFLAPICLALFVVAAASGDEPKKEAKFDAEKLLGDWIYVSGTRAGEKVEKDHLAGKVTFTKDTLTVPGGGDQKFVIAYKVDAKASPVAIDMDIKDGPVKEGKALGIVSLDGDELKICYVAVMGKDDKRPAKFESTKDNKAFFFVLKREKK